MWGKVERIMRRRHAVDQTLPPVYTERLSNIDHRQLPAAYPQSQKREIWPVEQRLAAHEFTDVKSPVRGSIPDVETHDMTLRKRHGNRTPRGCPAQSGNQDKEKPRLVGDEPSGASGG
jgi:hypothetical protein